MYFSLQKISVRRTNNLGPLAKFWHANCYFVLFRYTAIFLGSLKLSHHEIKKSILNCDQTILTESAINSLLKYLPSADQVSRQI